MHSNPQKTMDLVTFTEEVRHEKIYLYSGECCLYVQFISCDDGVTD